MINAVKTLLGLHKARGGGKVGGSDKFMAVSNQVTIFWGSSNSPVMVKNKNLSAYQQATQIPYPKGSIGEKLGLRPTFIRVGLPTPDAVTAHPELACVIADVHSIDEAEKLGVVKIWQMKDGGEVISLTPSFRWDEGVLDSLMSRALKMCGYTDEDLLPAHPSWVKDNNNLMIVVRTPGSCTWQQFCQKCGITKSGDRHKKAYIRAGKDIWSMPVKNDGNYEKVIRLFVIPSIETPAGKKSHDGNFFVLPEFGEIREFLARGVPEICTETKSVIDKASFFILKGRAIVVDRLPTLGGQHAPAGCDGITTIDNLKWLDKEVEANIVGQIVTVEVIVSRDEETEDRGTYSLNLLALIMAKMSDLTDKRITGMFIRKVRKLTTRLQCPDKNVVRDITAILKADMASGEMLVLSEQIAKYHLGIMSDSERHMFALNLAKMALKSVKIPGSIYASVFFAEEWEGVTISRGQILVSGDPAMNRIGSKDVTAMRYPWVSYQSFMRLEVAGQLPGIHGRFIMMHPDDAVYCQGDGDDHVLIIPGKIRTGKGLKPGFESLFSPASEEEPFIARDLKDRGYDFTLGQLYWKGWMAQSLIGPIFNMMLKALAHQKDYRFDPTKTYKVFGGALDLCAQGIKKNYVLPDLEYLALKADSLCLGLVQQSRYAKMAEIYLKGDGDFEGAFGFSVKVAVPTRPLLLNRELSNCGAALMAQIVAFVKNYDKADLSLSNPVYWHIRFVKGLSAKLGGHLYSEGMSDAKILSWVDAYAFAAYTLKGIKGDVAEARLRVMNPMWILASQLTEAYIPEEAPASDEIEVAVVAPRLHDGYEIVEDGSVA